MTRPRTYDADDPSVAPEDPRAVHGHAVDQAAGAEAADRHSVVGGGQDLLDPARDVVQVEGAAVEMAPAPAAVAAWLFSGGEPRSVELAELPHLIADDANFVWVDVSDYTQQDLRGVAELLGVHPIAERIALASWQRPRLDIFGNQFLVSVTIPRTDPRARTVVAGQLDLFVGRNYLLSAHKQALPFADRIMARASGNPVLVEHDSAYMLYLILDELLEYDEQLGEHVQGEIENMEERALTDTSDSFLGDLLHFKRYTFALSHLADQHRPVFAAFLRPDFSFVSGEELQIYFRDLSEHFAQMSDTFGSARQALNDAFDIYVSHVSHRTNQVMKVLTIATVLALPASLIIALFSTNMRGFPAAWPGGFLFMLGGVLLATMLVLFILRRQRWI